MSDTDGNSALRSPHSAPSGEEGSNASPRAAARATVPGKFAHTQSDWWARWRKEFTPPEIWSEQRPSLRELWLYARYGPWTSESGLFRWLGRAYAWLIALPLHTAGYYLLWVVARPTRLGAAVLLYAVLAYADPGHALPLPSWLP